MLPLKDNIPTGRLPIVTILLIVINIAVFGWQWSKPDDAASSPELAQIGLSESNEVVFEYGMLPREITQPGTYCAPSASDKVVCGDRADFEEGGRYGDSGVDQPPWWITLVTSIFMHGGLLHIAGNMLFLWVFGNNVEDSMGRAKFVLFYLLAGVAASYSQALIDPESTIPTIGASGAVAGICGAYLLLHPRARVLTLIFIVFFVTLIEIPAMLLLGLWFILQFLPALGQLSTDIGGEGGVAYFAHVGGFVFGLLAIKLFASRRQESGSGAPYPVH